MAQALTLTVERRAFAFKGEFRIARGARTVAETLACTLSDGVHGGHGACVPYARYGETLDSVSAQIAGLPSLDLDDGLPDRLGDWLPPGAARTAVDCALWDLRAKRAGRPVHALIGASAPTPVPTAITVSLGTPQAMGAGAAQAGAHALIKIKLGGDGHDVDRMRAVHSAAPHAKLIADANESWTPDDLEGLMGHAAQLGVALIEQPLPAGADAALADMARPVPICADESIHAAAELGALTDRYDAINIKLDKTGGLTEALKLHEQARNRGMKIMVGCMVGSSLSMAPAVLLAQDADFVDLDGPLLLAEDCAPPLVYRDGMVHPADPLLWG